LKKKIVRGLTEAIILAVVSGIVLFAGWTLSKAHETQKSYTPTNLIRLHIVGNSDEKKDQNVKLMVRDALMSIFGKRLLDVKNVKDAEEILTNLLPEIEKLASDCLWQNGFTYEATASIKTVFFPDKSYRTSSGETVFLPEGNYKALEVVLGNGKGRNWWCVMYPPLCYFDLVKKTFKVTYGQNYPEVKAQPVVNMNSASSVVANDLHDVLIDELSTKEVPVELRFFFLDIVRKTARYLRGIFAPKSFYKICPSSIEN